MENEIIVPNAEPAAQEPSAETLKQIDALNEGVNGGHWIYVNEVGIVWQPNPETKPVIPTSGPPAVLSQLVDWGKSLDFDNLPYNAVLLIKLNVDDPMRVNMMQRAIAKQVLEPRFEKLKEKRTCILFMQTGDDITVMTEAEMNQAGWEKKEKSRIITSLS